MSRDRANDSLEHLQPLFEPSPTGAAKLLAAWDGLEVETQIRILEQKLSYPTYLVDRIRERALDSANAYVRYLAASGFSFRDDDAEEKHQLKRRIEEDPDPLVKYALLECGSALVDETLRHPVAFFALPQEARLAKVRTLWSDGELVAGLIHYALSSRLPQGDVSELDLFEILSVYVTRESFKAYYKRDYAGRDEYLERKDIGALWRLVPELPEAVSHVLIEHLPASEDAWISRIPDEVGESLSEAQLETLLYRDDLQLPPLRKRLFFEDEREAVRAAAISSEFDLTAEEFARVLDRPEEDAKVRTLLLLSRMARELSLPILGAVHDCLFATEYRADAKNALIRRLRSLRGPQRDRQIRELRLYYLACTLVPWGDRVGYVPSLGDLSFLQPCAQRGDTWGTYARMSVKWGRQENTERLEDQLPRLADHVNARFAEDGITLEEAGG